MMMMMMMGVMVMMMIPVNGRPPAAVQKRSVWCIIQPRRPLHSLITLAGLSVRSGAISARQIEIWKYEISPRFIYLFIRVFLDLLNVLLEG